MSLMVRYALAAIGPTGAAAAQFLLSLALLHALPTRDFGVFSFLLVTSILATSLWSALFCAPLLVALTGERHRGGEGAAHAIFATSGVMTLAFLAMFLAIAIALRLGGGVAAAFAVYAALGLVRSLGRAHAYAENRPLATTTSDMVYTISLLAMIGLLVAAEMVTMRNAFLIMLAATVAGLIAFGPHFLKRQLAGVTLARLRGYRSVWRAHSGWSLAGVVSTETVVNCHAYLVTIFAGPGAYAPIAATQLLLRPVTIATNALAEYERSHMAREVASGNLGAAERSVWTFRRVITLICIANAALCAAVLIWAPRLLFPDHYAFPLLVIGVVSWQLVGLVRAIRAPESALLQAVGEFRALAMASIYAAFFSVATVAVILWMGLPMWSIAGVLSGELVFLFWLWKAARKWLRSARGEERKVVA